MDDRTAGRQAGAQLPARAVQHVEAAMLSAWQRALANTGEPALTQPDATTLLGTSIDAARGRIESGNIRSSRDEHGRIRISASVTYTPDGTVVADAADSEALLHMWHELKVVREQLDASLAEEARLQAELDAAEKALEYTKAEVSNLWHVMTSRNIKQAARKVASELQEGPKVLSLAEQRTRIRTKVASVREIARRRKWPWGLVG